MPELPEVETVRRGLAPVMEGATFKTVELRRPDLRFPLPERFAERLSGVTVEALDRRGKYLIGRLSSAECLIMHLGMSGRFTIDAGLRSQPGAFALAQDASPKHDHVIFDLKGRKRARIAFNDPRRFGFMDLVPADDLDTCRHFKRLGPEPLSNVFSAEALNSALKGKKTLIKSALLDQRIVAGVGNIYACEALYRAKISPKRTAASVSGRRGVRLYRATVDVLREAIAAGGSSLKDFADAEGGLGYFQHCFQVYGRENDRCRVCEAVIRRITQAGRSTFYCASCQR